MTITANPAKTLRRKDVVTTLGLSKATIDRMISSGELASFKQGRSRLIPAASVDEYIARKREEAGAA